MHVSVYFFLIAFSFFYVLYFSLSESISLFSAAKRLIFPLGSVIITSLVMIFIKLAKH